MQGSGEKLAVCWLDSITDGAGHIIVVYDAVGQAGWAQLGWEDYNAIRDTDVKAMEAWATDWALIPNHHWSHLSETALETHIESHLKETEKEINAH